MFHEAPTAIPDGLHRVLTRMDQYGSRYFSESFVAYCNDLLRGDVYELREEQESWLLSDEKRAKIAEDRRLGTPNDEDFMYEFKHKKTLVYLCFEYQEDIVMLKLTYSNLFSSD